MTALRKHKQFMALIRLLEYLLSEIKASESSKVTNTLLELHSKASSMLSVNYQCLLDSSEVAYEPNYIVNDLFMAVGRFSNLLQDANKLRTLTLELEKEIIY